MRPHHPGTVNALVAAYLDPASTSPFKTGTPETRRTRKYILERFREKHGDKPVFKLTANGERVMLLKREHVQKIVNGRRACRRRSAACSPRCAPCSSGP